ncbi:MAG: DsbA family protein [Candidatus Paceibacterota bacterium]|jgi:protein-disulfide isomerase
MESQKNIFVIAISIIVAGLVIGGAVLYNGSQVAKEQKADLTDTLPLPPDEVNVPTTITIDTKGHPFIGKEDAPVTIIEVSDFECPFCKTFAAETMPKLKETYIDTGKVKFFFVDFPLPYHPNAQKAAEAALCYVDQGKDYYDIYKKLYEKSDALEVENLKIYAKDLKVDTKKFNACLDDGKFADQVKASFENINKVVQESNLTNFGTPAFFVNGKPLIGAQKFDAFQGMIDDELETTTTTTSTTATSTTK